MHLLFLGVTKASRELIYNWISDSKRLLGYKKLAMKYPNRFLIWDLNGVNHWFLNLVGSVTIILPLHEFVNCTIIPLSPCRKEKNIVNQILNWNIGISECTEIG